MTRPIDRFTPLSLGLGQAIANRIVVPAMASTTADEHGFVTAETEAHYRRLAQAGAGLLFVEYTYVHRSGRSEPNQLGASDDAHVPGLARLAASIRAAGSLPALQLTHAGGKTSRELTGGPLMGPSDVAVPVKDSTLEPPEPVTAAGIQLWLEAFVAAADRGVAAGFAMVELHSAHGYGLNQWLSPITNRRADGYGGGLEARMRLMLEVIAGIRARHPALLLSVRIPGQDHLPGGLTREDALAVARRLTAAGVNVINVSSGLGGWRRPRDRAGEGYLVAEAAFIQAGLAAPVIGVGGIETAAYIDEALAEQQFALAAVGRAILADPLGWSHHNLTRPGLERRSIS